MEGFLDMNYSQNTPHECLEESLKQTMLDHEIIFKKQVHELHRLYAIQKSLMMGDAKYTRCEFLPMKRIFAESHLVGSTRFILNNSSLQEDRDFCSRIQQRPLDLQLSTGNFCYDDVLGDEEVNLSLSIGRSTNKRSRIAGKTWKNKILYPPSRDIIDLEESIETGSNEDSQPVFSLDQSSRNSTDHLKRYPSHGMPESLMNGGNVHQDHLKKNPFCGMPESLMNSGMHQAWSSFNQGSNEWHGVKQTISMDLDLNKDQPDESSFHSNEPLGPNPSSSSAGESCSRIGQPIEVSTSPTSTLKQQKSETGVKDIHPKACTIDFESLPEPSSDLIEEKERDIADVTEQKEKEGSDYSVQKAALSLISISLQRTSTSNQDSEAKSGSNEIENDDENQKKTIPRSSSIDSYESLVLKLEESSKDEDCVTSKAFEINELDQKENGIKLRRGRRLKDFQKDILPTLSSLSRHEIWEDINILEGVIRSREYKRLHKAKTGSGENWFTPVRSKRSKGNHIGRRCSQKKKSMLSYAAQKLEFVSK